MSMERARARLYVTDLLCGQATAEALEELEGYLADHPDFVRECRELQRSWELLEVLNDPEGLLGSVAGEDGAGSGQGDGELADDDLDMVVGGVKPPEPIRWPWEK